MKSTYKYSNILLIFLAGQLIAGCKVAKDLSLNHEDVPQVYRGATTPAVGDSTSIGSLPWRTFFEDAELNNLIGDALNHNNDLQVAVKNIEAADLTLKQARQGNIPTLGIAATATSSRPSDNSMNGLSLNQFLGVKHIEDYTLAASVSWEADIWGKIRNRTAAALASYLNTSEARKGVQTRIVSEVAKGYYNLMMLDAQLLIAKQNVKLNDSTLSIIRLQYVAGQVTSLAVQQAQAQELTAAGLIPQFEQQIVVQENAINILCGRAPDNVARKNSLDTFMVSQTLKAGLPIALLSRRPDVRQSELAVSQANATVGYTKANLYPSLNITAQGGLDAFKASNWFNIPASIFGVVGGSLLQPIFNQKKLATPYRIAKINREQAVIQFRQSVLVAVGEVSDALVKLDKLKQQQALAAGRTSTLQQATRNSQLLFKNGLATYLEVITAQGSVLQSELELTTIKKAQLDATVDLYRSVGGGWQ